MRLLYHGDVPLSDAELARALVAYYRTVKRDLPWRQTSDPYAVWVSEIMLQQTRVATVIPYYRRWLERFPTVGRLAAASLDDVLAAWSGLGYYSRARNLHRGARYVVDQCGGQVPRDVRGLRALPGVGRYTAGAIASIAYGLREPVVDGNVARVLARLYALDGDVKSSAVTRQLWALADALVPADAPGDFNQGLMELGATVCTPTSPTCLICPLRKNCQARARGLEQELPRMPRRKASESLPLIDMYALWIVRADHVVLARRAPSGLFGGLWELPQSEMRAELHRLVTGAALSAPQPVHEHRQTLTHRRLRIRVYPAEIQAPARPTGDAARDDDRNALPALGKPADERYERLIWQPLDAVTKRGVSAATRAIVDAYQKTGEW